MDLARKLELARRLGIHPTYVLPMLGADAARPTSRPLEMRSAPDEEPQRGGSLKDRAEFAGRTMDATSAAFKEMAKQPSYVQDLQRGGGRIHERLGLAADIGAAVLGVDERLRRGEDPAGAVAKEGLRLGGGLAGAWAGAKGGAALGALGPPLIWPVSIPVGAGFGAVAGGYLGEEAPGVLGGAAQDIGAGAASTARDVREAERRADRELRNRHYFRESR